MEENPSNFYWYISFFYVVFSTQNKQYVLFHFFADLLLILEHSFYLVHQKDSQPLLSAAEKYKASNTPKNVRLATKGIFDQYGQASKEEKVEMISNVILQNRMSM
jgi:hypothetical protein